MISILDDQGFQAIGEMSYISSGVFPDLAFVGPEVFRNWAVASFSQVSAGRLMTARVKAGNHASGSPRNLLHLLTISYITVHASCSVGGPATAI